MESFPLGLTLPDFELSKKLSQRFSEDLGCGSDLKNLQTCIVTKSIPEILAAQVSSENVITPLNPLFIFMPWQPTVDGTVVENSVLTAVYNGIYKKVPAIWGTVEQEGLMFVVQVWPDGIPNAEYEVIIRDIFGSNAKGVLQNYPPVIGAGNGTLTQMSHLATQYLFICPTINMSQTMIQALGANTDFYLYRYDHVMSFYEAWGPNYTFCYDAVCHGAELPFVFHSADKIVPPFNYTAEELILTAQMSNYWGNFANTGNPNTGPNPVGVQWPQYNSAGGFQNIILETPQISTESLEYNSICQFWNTVGYEIQ
jgi:acetylcholinesterase/cholinesterase